MRQGADGQQVVDHRAGDLEAATPQQMLMKGA